MIERKSSLIFGLEKDDLSPQSRMLIVASEIGSAAKLVDYMTRKEDSKAYKADLKVQLGDAIVQIELLCLKLGWTPEEVKQLGIDHTLERLEDFAAKGWK